MTSTPGLDVRAVTVAYSGLVALDGVTLRAPRQQITGLIGPNGAGKTTLFNACTGWVRPKAGVVLLDGVDLSAATPAQRARHGLGRTFQRMELFDDLTVRENVALGREAAMAGRGVIRQLVTTRRERAEVSAATDDSIARCGLDSLGERQVGELSTGQRRLVELARALAGDFRLLLLDEPSSGLDGAETERFGEVVVEALSERDFGILLVEHDMSLVMAVCSYIYVLDFGELIFAGAPEEVAASEVVRAAYLGTEVA
jgi:ABC-type branched-subunit amino acid transport system ATPase component